jgi:hypothetical protein
MVLAGPMLTAGLSNYLVDNGIQATMVSVEFLHAPYYRVEH